MKKNLLQKEVGEEMIQRILQLTKASQIQWGTMTATEMLHHCQAVNKNILEGTPDGKKPTFKQWLLKMAFMNIKKELPKNVKGPARLDAKKSNIKDSQFDEKKALLIETIKRFGERKDPIEVAHPIFGRLNTKEWGFFTWKHMDHHLRQFGV